MGTKYVFNREFFGRVGKVEVKEACSDDVSKRAESTTIKNELSIDCI